MGKVAWIMLPLLWGCVFDRSGLDPTLSSAPDDRAPGDQPAAMLDLGTRLEAGSPLGDTTLDGARAPDAPAADVLPPPDTVFMPDSSPCILDEFTGPTGWKVTPQRGDWVWKSPSTIRQQKIDAFGAHALVQGSEPMVSGFSAQTTCTVTDVYDNGAGQGAGLSLLVKKVSSSHPYRQVMCLTWVYGGSSTTANLALAYYQGQSYTAYSFSGAKKSLSSCPKGVPVTYTMSVKQQGAAWMATCAIAFGSVTESVTANVSSIVDATPLGVALFSTGVTADFDRVEVCPAP